MNDKRQNTGPLVCVVGARPNYMKMAPLVRAFAMRPDMPGVVLVHTGQHYDVEMNERLFADLELPAPDLNLEVGSGTHAAQTAEIMRRFEPVLDRLAPSCVIVVGDVNSTLACSLVAAKKRTPVVHVEAGLRSFDRDMPEEINRVLTDQIADLLFITERSAADNLAREGIPSARIRFVGNVMIDSLLRHRRRAVAPSETLSREGVRADFLADSRGFGVVTLHRPSNVDEPSALREALSLLRDVAGRLPLIWPVHPRAKGNIERFGLASLLADAEIVLLPPQGYLEMLGLLAEAKLVLTDSGGIQEEATALDVPCLTMRDNTERPITVEQGTNTLVGRNRGRAMACLDEILRASGKRGRIPELWDGHAAERIADELHAWLGLSDARRLAASLGVVTQ
jgi:UDP-N-acetylglucosamine 2-epimerase (non-hydrolysing)